MKDKKLRSSTYRDYIVDIISVDKCFFLSIPQIQKEIEKRGLRPNKTTIYREVKTLVEKGVINEVFDNSGIIKYEYSDKKHHHHFICLKCDKVIPLECFNTENLLESFFLPIEKKYNFKIDFNFFDLKGYCSLCMRNL
jgi:Fur family zinc uptake transcriptional regulator